MRHLAALLCLCVLACSSVEEGLPDAGSHDAGDTTPDAGSAPMTLDEWLDADLHYGCAVYVCFFGLAPSESAAFCGDEPEKRALRRAAFDAGRLRYEPGKARACVEALAPLARDCWGPEADLAAWDPVLDGACGEVLVGTVVTGAACFADEECAAGSCDVSAQQCPGTCRPFVAAGGTCARAAMCQAGLSCSAGKCVAPGDEGMSCDAGHPCKSALSCEGGTCRNPLPLGSACELGGQPCAPLLRCASGGVSTTPTCRERLPAGGACTQPGAGLGIASPDCAGNQVCRGLMLDDEGDVLFAGTCATPGDAGATCAPLHGNPGMDESSTGCLLGIGCDEDASVCAALPGPGKACVLHSCDQTAFCDAGICRALLADGEPCQASSDCQNVCLSPGMRCGPSPVTPRCLPSTSSP